MTLVAAAVFSLTRVRELGAERSELRLTPAEPERGEVVTVEYRATAMFAGEARLVLRARYRSPTDPANNLAIPKVSVAELVRDDGRVFRGRIQLPANVVYAVFAVEDTSGRQVDSNGNALWELLTHSVNKPELPALIQKQNDLTGRNWHAAYEAARSATELYPGSPEAWGRRVAYETVQLRGDAAEGLLAGHRSTFATLATDFLESQAPSSSDLGWLYWYARTGVQDSSLTAVWRARLIDQAPTHPIAVQVRALELAAPPASHPARLLQELESLWLEVGPAHPQLPLQGYWVAERLNDPEQLLRWAERRLIVEPWEAANIASDLVAIPSARAFGMEMLRDELRRLDRPSEQRRALRNTVEQSWLERERARSKMLAVLGSALIDAGKAGAGIDTLDMAAAAIWDPSVFQAVADAKLALGDSTGALEMLARVAVDPATNPDYLDSITAFARAQLHPDRWGDNLRAARGEMRERVLALSISRPVATDLALKDLAGNRLTLGQLIGRGVTVVAVWSPYCPPCLTEPLRLQQIVDRIRLRGGRAIVIISDAPAADIRRFLADAELDVPIYIDISRAVQLGLGSWIVPNYLVLDASKRVRFEGTALTDMLRAVDVLIEEVEMLVAGTRIGTRSRVIPAP
jgi:peroxiredoxin